MDREFRRSRGRGVGLVVALALLSLLIAACGGGASPTPVAAPSDPTAIIARAVAAPMDQVEVRIGIETSGGTVGDMSIDPDSIVVTVDSAAGKGSFHLSLPSSALGSDASMLGALGATGDTIDLDVLYDGQALYAKSPLAASLLPLLLAQSGQTISGDLTGWLRLGTADDLASLGDTFGATPDASAAPSPLADLDPEQLKADLEASGVTVTYAGTEDHNGVQADHLTMTIDGQKLASGPLASELPSVGGDQIQTLAGSGTLTADAWFDQSTGRVMEIDLAATETDGSTINLTILVSTPSSTSFEAPSSFTDVPIAPLLSTLMQTFGGSLTNP